MVDTTTEFPGSGGGGNAGSSFSERFFNVYQEGTEAHPDITLSVDMDSPVATPSSTVLRFVPTGDLTITFQDTSGSAVVATSTTPNIFSQIQEFDFDGTITRQVWTLVDSDAAVRLNILGPTFLSIDRTQRFPDASGMYTLVGDDADPPAVGFMGKVDRTAQTADVASTKLTDATSAGFYSVQYVLEATTGDLAAGTVTLTLAWTDDAGATTAASSALVLTTAGRTSGMIPLYLASGNVTYSVAHTGIFGSSQYALRMRIVNLG